MNNCEEVEIFNDANSTKRKKKRRHKKLSTDEEKMKTDKNIENIIVDDTVFHIGENGDNLDQFLLNTNFSTEEIETNISVHLSNEELLLTSNKEKNNLTPKIWQQDLYNENVDSIQRSRSVSELATAQLSLQNTCSSVPDLVVDNQSQSTNSLRITESVNRIYQPPTHRGPQSVFSSKIKNNNICDIKESQLQIEFRNELLKYFPEKIAKIMIITWNMASISTYPELLHDLIGNNNSDEMSDLYLFCFQETSSNKHDLLTRLQMSVGGHYVIYSFAENGSLLCVLVGHKKFIWNLALMGKGSLSTRITPITKGAVAISFQFFGNTILFLGSHFSSNLGTSGDKGRNSLRLEDYKSILYSRELIKTLTNPDMKLGPDETNLSHYFDYTFWAGDLNFRISRDDVTVARLILSELECQDGQAFEELLEYDELINCQAAGLVFQEFEEARITFLPTYRFIIQTDEYTEKRTPSYTDRILFRSHKCRAIECVYYNSVKSYNYSDHKPVCAVMEINLDPQKSEHLKSAGNFNKEIYNKCFDECETKQSKTGPGKSLSNPQSQMCSIQ